MDKTLSINGHKFIDNEMDYAMEGKFVYNFKKEYTLRDNFFPYVESILPKTEKLLFRHIAEYEDRNSEILNSPYLTNYPVFMATGKDRDILFKCTQIDIDELDDAIKQVPLPGDKEEKANFTSLNVVILMIIRYYYMMYMKTKKKEYDDKLKVMYCYAGYALYWNRYRRQFLSKVSRVNSNVMIYTINELNYRYKLKQLGSIKALLLHSTQTATEAYLEELVDFSDEDIRYIIDQYSTRLGNYIKEIADRYYTNYRDKKEIMTGNPLLDDQGTQREDTSRSAQIAVLAQKYTSSFYMTDINMSMVKLSIKQAGGESSATEVKTTLTHILNNVPSEEVKRFYEAMFYVYIIKLGNDPSTVNGLNFLFGMRDVFKKGTSADPNIITIRTLLNKWLEASSNVYRVTKRDPTKTGYRKSVFFYFVNTVAGN